MPLTTICNDFAVLKNYAQTGRIIVFDTETSGSKEQEVVQVSAVEYQSGVCTRTFNRYINPQGYLAPWAVQIHHLTRQFLKGNGTDAYQAMRDFFDFVGTDVLAVGHNIRFDVRAIDGECTLCEYSPSIYRIDFCDTLSLSRKLLPDLESHKLCSLIESLNLCGENSHNAADDAQATAELFFHLVRNFC